MMGSLASEFLVPGFEGGRLRASRDDAVELEAALLDHEEFAELEDVVAVLLLLPHDGARGVRIRHRDIAAPGA